MAGHALQMSSLPIYNEEGVLAPQKVKEILFLSNEETAKLVGVSEATIRKNKASVTTIGKFNDLVHTLNILWDLTDASKSEVRKWLHNPKKEWGGKSPIKMMSMGKLKVVTEYLEGVVDGEVGGS